MTVWLTDPEAWIALITLTALEIVLGIDNIIILTILVAKLPTHTRQLGRILGLTFAMLTRILLLLSLVWVIHLTKPLFSIFGMGISARDIILIVGGLFLIWKSTYEIHQSMEGESEQIHIQGKKVSFWGVIVQIGLIDIVFSLDSVITAVGLANHIQIMIIAIIIAVIVMMFASKTIGEFVDAHPTIKMLALSFLLLIGVFLIAEGMDFHVPKGYLYFAMAFSVGVEMLNLRYRARRQASSQMKKH